MFVLAGSIVASEQKKMEENLGFGNSGKISNLLQWGDILTRIFSGNNILSGRTFSKLPAGIIETR